MSVGATIIDLIEKTTAKWAKQRKAEIRDANARFRRSDNLSRRFRPMNQTEAAWAVMPEAYRKAAGGVGRANPRQIYYVARGPVEAKCGKEPTAKYFCQTLLVNYVATHPRETAGWDIIWDARGHFREPHTGHEIGLGTEEVRDYIGGHQKPEISPIEIAAPSVKTSGPAGRYGGVMYIEKEGFDPMLDQAEIAERFDLALTSSKGMSVTACRTLVEELCGRRGLPLYILHDFDGHGFSIKQTLFTSNRRYRFKHPIKTVIDLGVRLADIEWFAANGSPLPIERVIIPSSKAAFARRLRINGATPAEIEFLTRGAGKLGQRVELNAMTSDQFVAFVERKLREHGAAKLIPAAEMLVEAFTKFKRGAEANRVLKAELARLNAEPVDVPGDLERRVRAHLKANPTETWDDAVMAISTEGDDGDDDDDDGGVGDDGGGGEEEVS